MNTAKKKMMELNSKAEDLFEEIKAFEAKKTIEEVKKKQEVKKVITDPQRVQELKNSIMEGEIILRSGKFNGEKKSKEYLEMVQRQVSKEKEKIWDYTPTASIDERLAKSAHQFTSFSPDIRAKQEIEWFKSDLNNAYEELSKSVKTPEQKQILENEMKIFEWKYKDKYSSYLSAKSRTASPMITWPARFPTARNEKAMNTERKRSQEAIEFYNKWIKAIKKKIENTGKENIDPISVLKTEIDVLKKRHEQMKEINFLFRKTKDIKERENILREKFPDFKDETIKELLKDWSWFESFSLTNNLERIKYKETRLRELERKWQKETSLLKNDLWEIVDNKEADRIQILFDWKPSDEIIAKLKSKAFKWSPKNKAWQRMRTENSMKAAKDILWF